MKYVSRKRLKQIKHNLGLKPHEVLDTASLVIDRDVHCFRSKDGASWSTEPAAQKRDEWNGLAPSQRDKFEYVANLPIQ